MPSATSISSNSSLTLLETDSFPVFLKAIVSRTRAKGLSRLSGDDNTAVKMFVCLSVQGLFFCVLERFTFFFAPFCFPKVLCFRSSSSLIGAFSPKTRPGNPSKCEFVMHFDEFLV